MRKLMIVLLAGAICLLGVTSALAVKYNEAPMLKTKVAAGLLPPVEERLPEEPLVIKPLEEIGQYGGEIRSYRTDPSSAAEAWMLCGIQSMLRITENLDIVPNIARDIKFSEDGKTLTIYLRKGIRWSDGAPFTADDVLFWYEDVLLNDELSVVMPRKWTPGGELMKMEKLDDYTIRLHFAAPYPVARIHLAHEGGALGEFYLPKHYMRQFHPRYTSMEKLKKMVKEEGFEYWYQLFDSKRSLYWPGVVNVPVINPYLLKEKTVEDLVYERNPYYWKVDTAGNQLPYIDRIRFMLVSNAEVINAKVVSGECDFDSFYTSLENYPLYMENAEKGSYRVLLWQSTWGAEAGFGPNLTYNKDPILRDIFRDVRFRRALSLAIDREDINEALYFGKAVPRQLTVVPQCSYYEERFATSYADYNPEEANRLLDEMGLKWDEEHKYRLRPDGKVLSWTIEYYPGERPRGRVAEVVLRYWKEIGLKVNLKQDTAGLIGTRILANEVAMNLGDTDATTDIMFPLCPYWSVPMNFGWEWTWEVLWGQWYESEGEAGEEPPTEMKRLLNLWEKMKTTMDDEERVRLGKEILASQAENLWTIGTVGLAPSPIIVRDSLRNIPDKALLGWDVLFGSPYNPEQYFFKQK